MDTRTRRPARWQSVLLALAAFAVLLPLLEVAVRLAVPRQVDVPHLRVHPEGFYTWEPDTAFVYQNLEHVEPPSAEVRVNGHGLRGGPLADPKPPGSLRVLVLGDSFTAAVQLPEARIFTTLLEERLQRGRPNVPVEVANAGFNGAGTAQELLYFVHRGVHLAADVVVLQFTYNDVADNVRHGGYRLEDGRLRLAPELAAPPWWKGPLFAARDYLGNRSLAFYLGYRSVKALLGGGPAEAALDDETRRRIALTHRLAARLVERANRAGAAVAILVIPWPLHVGATVPVYEHIKAGLAAIADGTRSVVVVMDEPFRGALGRSADVYLQHDGHLGVDGHRLVAEELARAIDALPPPAGR